MVVDADTGLVLRQANQAFDTFHEWTEIDTDADLSDELFIFDPDADTIADPLPG
jgi:hypothetical protein